MMNCAKSINTQHIGYIFILLCLSVFSSQVNPQNQKIAETAGLSYDMMWNYSTNFDDGPSSVARFYNDLERVFEVNAIELGNEHFLVRVSQLSHSNTRTIFDQSY